MVSKRWLMSIGYSGVFYGLAIILGLLIVFVSYGKSAELGIKSSIGDLNGDGDITPADALIAFRCYLGLDSCPKYADVNQDGSVTPADALCLFKKYLGQPSCLDNWVAIPQAGYVLLWDGVRVGYEPDWTRQEAIENLKWNTGKYPDKKVEGWYNGEKLVVEGYRLFYNGVEVGHEPAWDPGLAISNFRWNTETHLYTKVTATYDGVDLYYLKPGEVEVLPVYFVPVDQALPTSQQIDFLKQHLSSAQGRYREMLFNQDTFTLSDDGPVIYRSSYNLSYYKAFPDSGAGKCAIELFDHLDVNRFNCPYIFLVIIMNNVEDWPPGGGIPLNGDVNRGGGIVIMSSYGLTDGSFKQATLQHELGHSFGLMHVESYHYNMWDNPSIMSYNQDHHWNGLNPPHNQGILIPEDLRIIAKNKLVFPNFYFSPYDIPAGYNLAEEPKDTLPILDLSSY